MAAKTQITNKGLELLASSSKATGQHWWIGWYALAFVPDELQDESGEKLGPNMTKLTEEGDIIYNIFQGDMNGDGYQTTKASDKFKAVNYDSNIKKNYRYVLDEDGRNNLVTFVDGKNGLKGACVYPGVKVNESRDDNSIDYAKSKIPLPAPLLYTGVLAAGEGWSTNGMNIFLGTGNDRIENFYPVDKDSSDLTIPRVSADFRNYEGYKNGLTKRNDGEQAYPYALTDITDEGVDFDGWFPSVYTYTQNDDPTMDYNQFCRQYWKVLSISNFNKYCAPVNASGLLYDENTGCRNMAKATKYFPISDYSVTSTAKTADNEYATGIKLKVQLKLNGNAEDGAYFKDVEMADEDNVATLNPDATTEEHQLFNTQQVSFKFNRIGIYAVPMRQYGCSDDSSEMKAQYQIDTEAEPVLFAVCEWDSPVTLSDSGEGLSEFQSDVFIDLSAAVEDSSVIRESAVFYNLYEDDAIDWYKNQLLANASMAEALVNMQIEMGYLRNQKNAKQGCCPKQEAIQQNSKSVAGLRNLVDARDYNSNSVRNRLAVEEGIKLNADYSDKIPELSGFGGPEEDFSNRKTIHARKAVVDSTEYYSASFSEGSGNADAIIDGHTYENLLVDPFVYDSQYAIRIGGLWVHRNLFYEMFTFAKPTSQATSMTFDYPDEAEAYGLVNGRGDVVDYFGTDTEGRSSSGYITVTKTATGISVDDDGTVTDTLPPELSAVEAFSEEINRDIGGYETQRVYEARYLEDGTSRDYTGFKFKRTTSLQIPKTQFYKISEDSYSTITNHLGSTGWRIPTEADWEDIIANCTKEKANRIKFYPLGGAASGRAGISLYIPDTPSIYLAIAGRLDKVVEFDGDSFKIIDKPNFPSTESALAYVSVLCVADAKKISDGTNKYKLGYDSYALMEGSITEGSHNFNAGQNSSIFASANYNSIFGGMYNKVNDSDYNAILGGSHVELLNTVFSAVCGDDTLVQGNEANTCGIMAAARRSVLTHCVSSLLAVDLCKVTDTFASCITAESSDISSVHYSKFAGKYVESNNDVEFSDVTALNVYHLPLKIYMSRLGIAYDGTKLPTSLEYAPKALMTYSELTGEGIYFLKKTAAEELGYESTIELSRVIAGGNDPVGFINTGISYSDIFAYGDASSIDSRAAKKTLESISIGSSTVKLAYSSIMSSYVEDDAVCSGISFCDLTLYDTLVLMSANVDDTSTRHDFSFGVMRLSHSILSECDCSYVYESGTRHFLNSARVHYASLVGNLISLSSNYIQNTHIYGSLTLGGDLANHIILGGLDGTNIGSFAASAYISDFGSYILSNYHGYPMIWSMGGIGLYMNKMILGDKGLDSQSKSPEIGDVLTVVGVEGNLATVAWMPGGSGRFGTLHLELEFDFSHANDPKRGDGDDYAKNPWECLVQESSSISVNGNDVTPEATVGDTVDTMNTYMPADIKFQLNDGKLVLKNASSTDYLIKGSARCDKVIYAIDEPGRGYPWGWKIWDTDAFYPYSLGDANSPCDYSASLRAERVSPNGLYTDLVRTIAFGYTTTATATGGSADSGDICSEEVGDMPQQLVCKWIVDISYRKM